MHNTFAHLSIDHSTQPTHVWFDRNAIEPTAAEARSSHEAIYASVAQLIDAEVAAGIPLQRIAVGGFSMGGALALHVAYHVRPEVRACFALSSFLNLKSIVYETLSAKAPERPAELLMMHGERDRLVRPDWGRQTFDALRAFGVPGAWKSIPNASHELKRHELKEVIQWLEQMLPAEPAGKL